ncbi:MAG TPA: DNA mismatch repair protein MutS, partial [Candidatus Binataceae bacterium]|nr:DNA mismatch repair protein MutS [Candidatus Binataceae bacterium]
EPYIARLLKAGHKVAICEQSAAEPIGSSGKGGVFQLTASNEHRGGARGLMPRQVVRVITPGTVGEEMVLVADEKSFLLAIAPDGDAYALAALDVSTGEFVAARVGAGLALREEIVRIAPREILAPREAAQLRPLLEALGLPRTELDSAAFEPAAAREALAERFGAECDTIEPALASAAAAAMRYAEENFGHELGHLRAPRVYHAAEYMLVDETSRAHLELIGSSDGTRSGSLLAVLDETLTPIGARTLANWIVYPLMDLSSIHARLDAVEELFDSDLGGAVAETLKRIGDLERLGGRIGSLRASPRDVLKLAEALAAVATLKDSLGGRRSELLRAIGERLRPEPELVHRIEAVVSDEPPVNPRDGNAIRPGFSAEVDELRALALDARGVIARLEAMERERTRIPSLKVRYNQVFGYYLEVTKPHLERVPSDYERKQTLVGAERFTTPALKELERKILSAESGLKELETQLFIKLLRDLALHSGAILESASAVGQFDALRSLAQVARRRGYVRPMIDSGLAVRIRDGRHPVLEAGMKAGEFVPNDLDADATERQLLLITGPNMAGKSTYLRQVALIVIMAQMGSFVPATEACVGVTDRVLTRIGARDELRRGDSTFMVEMRETARLLGGLSERSLLLLDEVGRGTSTFDGLAIAWAVAEYLHDSTRAKVLFATHFHELTELARERPRVKNLSMAVREWGGEVLFLRRVNEGAASRSYGIEVARLAGLPPGIIARARQILNNLEQGEFDETGLAHRARHPGDECGAAQLSLFASTAGRVIEELRALDIDRITPVDALNTLASMALRLRQSDD